MDTSSVTDRGGIRRRRPLRVECVDRPRPSALPRLAVLTAEAQGIYAQTTTSRLMAYYFAVLFFTIGLSLGLSLANRTNPITARAPLETGSISTETLAEPRGNPGPTLNCTECTGRDLKRSYRLESIKTDILRKLRLSAPPNVTGMRLPNVPLLRQMIASFGNSTGSSENCGPTDSSPDLDDDRLLTMRVIQFSKPEEAPASSNSSLGTGFVYFQLPTADIRLRSQIIRASLGIYIRSSASETRPPTFTWLLVYRLGSTPNSESGVVAQDRTLIRRKKIALTPAETGKWYHFDCKALLQDWVDQPTTNYGLLIHASDGQGEPLAVSNPRNELETSHRPYLEIETRSQHAERGRRAFELNCQESSAEQRCCRYPLIVDFDAFGWDWIIVPKRYSAFYCSGECPFLYYQQDSHGHAVQQAKPDGAGMPCCSPKRVSSISMLYYDDSMNIVYGRLPGMVVERCGCA